RSFILDSHTPRPALIAPSPTRRSSDLPPAALAGSPGPSAELLREHSGPVLDGGGAESTGDEQLLGPVELAPGPRSCSSPVLSAPDRKSTRLNSSHVSISYAVSCLTTKN